MSLHHEVDGVQPDAAEAEVPETPITQALMTELVRLRKKRKIGQEPIAKAIGLTQSRVSQLENLKGGSITLEAFLLYAKTIGVEVVMVPAKDTGKGSSEG